MDFEGFSRDISSGVIAMISFSGSSFGVRIGLDSSLSELKECVCERWSEINHCLFEMYVIRDEKEIVVSTDEEIRCMICSIVIKGENTVNVFVRLAECSNSNAVANDTCSASSGSVTRSDVSEFAVKYELQSSYCSKTEKVCTENVDCNMDFAVKYEVQYELLH
ncbi:hypothetical protein LguiB_021349 [Lonicera macranthoides]